MVADGRVAAGARRVRHGLRRGNMHGLHGLHGLEPRSTARPSATPTHACGKSICPWVVRRKRRWCRVSIYSEPPICPLCVHTWAVRSMAVLCPSGAQARTVVDVIGHPGTRRALEAAAAGGHHLLMIGPPGAGKSMLAARLPSLLPPMTDDEALSSAAMLGFSPAQWRQRPFRAPHHSSSSAALVGGRNPPQPGEITLAHLGVLFLDELQIRPESARNAARTAGSRTHHHFARRASGGFSGSVSIGRSDESLSVRLARRSERPLSMHARHSHALSAQIVGEKHIDWRNERDCCRASRQCARPATRAARKNEARAGRTRSGCRLPARCHRGSPASRSRRTFRLVGTGVLPRAEGSAHDRRSGRSRFADRCPPRRSDSSDSIPTCIRDRIKHHWNRTARQKEKSPVKT